MWAFLYPIFGDNIPKSDNSFTTESSSLLSAGNEGLIWLFPSSTISVCPIAHCIGKRQHLSFTLSLLIHFSSFPIHRLDLTGIAISCYTQHGRKPIRRKGHGVCAPRRENNLVRRRDRGHCLEKTAFLSHGSWIQKKSLPLKKGGSDVRICFRKSRIPSL